MRKLANLRDLWIEFLEARSTNGEMNTGRNTMIELYMDSIEQSFRDLKSNSSSKDETQQSLQSKCRE